MRRRQVVYGSLFLIGCALLGVAFLVPTVDTGGNQGAAQARTKAQLSNYVTALNLFYGEYGYFPSFFRDGQVFDLDKGRNTERFVEAISGRDHLGNRVQRYGNDRGIQFCQFSDDELVWSSEGRRLVLETFMERLRVVLLVDHDGDGMIYFSHDSEVVRILVPSTAYAVSEDGESSIELWH